MDQPSGDKKRIGFVELPDEALDLFGYYAQRPTWEVGLVVSVDPMSYAARMAEVLKIPVLDRPNRPALVACDRLIVGKRAGLMAMILDLVEDTEIEVIPLDSAIMELAASHGKSQITPRPDLGAAKGGAPAAAGSSSAAGETVLLPVPEPPSPPPASKPRTPSPPGPSVPAPRSSGKAAAGASPAGRERGPSRPEKRDPDSGEYTSTSTFDAGTLLGQDFREKLGALQIDEDGDQLLHEILKMAVRATHADSGSIMLVDESGKNLRIAVADGLPHWVISQSRQAVGKGVSGVVFATGKPRLVHGHLAESASASVRPGLREAACVPILTKEGAIGVLNVSVESEKKLGRSAIGLLNMFAREASGAVLKALSLRSLSGTVHREAVIRQVERLMSLQETLPSRFRSVGEVLCQNLGADFAHCFVVDSEMRNLVLFGSPRGTAAFNTRPQPLDRGILGWVLRHGHPEVLETSSGSGREGVAMAYLPFHGERPYAVLVLEKIPLRNTTAGDVKHFITEIQEVVEAYIAVEASPGSGTAREDRRVS